jgi:hypothetical protein
MYKIQRYEKIDFVPILINSKKIKKIYKICSINLF